MHSETSLGGLNPNVYMVVLFNFHRGWGSLDEGQVHREFYYRFYNFSLSEFVAKTVHYLFLMC